MAPRTFRDNRRQDSPRATPKRRRTFRDEQLPLPKQQRTFGTDITNKARYLRPVFKQGERTGLNDTPARPLELLKDPRKQVTPVKFIEPRREPDPQDLDLGASPLVKPKNASNTPLAALIETRCLELKAKKPSSEPLDVDRGAFEPYNAVCAINDDTIIMNPRKIPLEHAQIYRYGEDAFIAGIW